MIAKTSRLSVLGVVLALLTLQAAAEPSRITRQTHECFRYDTSCGTSIDAEITIFGCRRESGLDTKYWTRYRIQLSGQADVTASVTSTDFIPEIGIAKADAEFYERYESNSGRRNTVSVTARMPGGRVDIDIYAKSADTGTFRLTVSCVACDPPIITENPISTTVPYGTSATLSAAAIGKDPLRYAWFDAANPNVAIGAGQQFQTPPVTQPATYFARAINECGEARTLNAIVEPGACAVPQVQVPATMYSVPRGAAVNLDVIARGGAPLNVQWYEGTYPDTSKPVPSSGTRLTIPQALRSTSYWVRVSNLCGVADSPAIRLDVIGTARRRSARH
ncbi:MAG TPA: hypothetical protein VF911_10535 [Thermoanaerobaculia bacterium]